MHAVVVAVLPDVPEQDQDAFNQLFEDTARALAAIQPRPVRMYAAIKDVADAVREAVGHPSDE